MRSNTYRRNDKAEFIIIYSMIRGLRNLFNPLLYQSRVSTSKKTHGTSL